MYHMPEEFCEEQCGISPQECTRLPHAPCPLDRALSRKVTNVYEGGPSVTFHIPAEEAHAIQESFEAEFADMEKLFQESAYAAWVSNGAP